MKCSIFGGDNQSKKRKRVMNGRVKFTLVKHSHQVDVGDAVRSFRDETGESDLGWVRSLEGIVDEQNLR